MKTFTEDMTVERVRTDDGGTHVEPPLDPSWGDLAKLRWHAAVLYEDTKVRARVKHCRVSIGGIRLWNQYQISVGNGAIGPFDFGEAWTLITGISFGAEEVQSWQTPTTLASS